MRNPSHGFIRRACALLFLPLISITTTHAAGPAGPNQGNPLDNLPKTDRTAPSSVTIDIQQQEKDPALQRLLATRITPSRFAIAGVKTLPFEAVAEQFAGLANREVSIAQILEAADKVTRQYKERGYPLSFAFVPAQTFQDNVVVVNIVEGYVDTVKITGNPGASEDRLREIADQLKSDRPLTTASFEHIAAILSLQPGMRIDATVHPPVATNGASEMVLDVKRKPVTAAVALDTATSHLRGLVTVSENGLTPLGEQLSLSTLVPKGPDHEEYYGLAYAQPIGRQGATLLIGASDYTGEPTSAVLPPLQFDARYRTRQRRVSAALAYPLILTGQRNVTVTGGVYAVENLSRYTRSVPADPPSVEIGASARAMNLEIASSQQSDKSSRQLSAGVYQGFNGAGASLTNSNADLSFTRLRAQFSQALLVGSGFGVALSGMGQYSNSILPQSEQISFGARLFGAAYPAGEIAGDKGWGLSAEINRPISIDASYVKQVQPYVMTDRARSLFNTEGQPMATLASVGAGVRFGDLRHYSLDLSLAKPVGDRPVNDDSRSLRFNLSYTYQFD